MHPNQDANERIKLERQLKFTRVCLFFSLVACLVLALVDGYKTMHETTRVVPPEVRRPYVIGPDTANTDYLTDMSDYVLDKLLTTSPEIVDFNNQVVLKMATPEQYPALKTTLDTAALRIKRERITTLWTPRSRSVDRAANRVTTTGTLKTYISDVLVSSEQKSYVVELSFDLSGRTHVSKAAELVRTEAPRGSSAPGGSH